MPYYEDIPFSLCKKLHGLTINEALSKGLIDDLGDDNGDFLFPLKDNPQIVVGIVQGYIIQCSERLIEDYTPEEILENFASLCFFTYSLNGNNYSRLGRPNGLKLGKAIVTLKYDKKTKEIVRTENKKKVVKSSNNLKKKSTSIKR